MQDKLKEGLEAVRSAPVHGREDAAGLARRAMAAFDEPFHVGGLDLHVTASTGVRGSDGERLDPDQILRDADLAMYSAKARALAGKGSG